jgi:hypothetical protein
MDTIWLSGAERPAVLRVGLGLFGMSWQTWSLDSAIGLFS